MKFERDFAVTTSDFHVKSRTFSDFGSDEIKNMNISPDAFFHMALQIAQYRTFGVLRRVYEQGTVRGFHEGKKKRGKGKKGKK